MVDESVSVGEKVSIKKSVIGKHTTIGEKVKISNSVIMDHVTIKEGYVYVRRNLTGVFMKLPFVPELFGPKQLDSKG